MTHKEKATEIVSKFMKYKVGTEYRYHTLLEAKQCALIAVDFTTDSGDTTEALNKGLDVSSERLGPAAISIQASALVNIDHDILYDPERI